MYAVGLIFGIIIKHIFKIQWVTLYSNKRVIYKKEIIIIIKLFSFDLWNLIKFNGQQKQKTKKPQIGKKTKQKNKSRIKKTTINCRSQRPIK